MEKSGGDNPTSTFQRAAKLLLAGRPGDSTSSKHLADRAGQAFERLTKHLTRLLGEIGVKMLFERSIAVSGSKFPWLRTALDSNHPESRTSVLGHALENQEPETITDAFVEVLSSFVGLLKRLIGDGLVEQLLNEVWPTVFVPEAKDTP